MTYGNLLTEAQALRSHVTILSQEDEQRARVTGSGARVVGPKEQAVGPEVPAVNPRAQAIGRKAGIVSPKGRAIGLGALVVGLGGLEDGPRVKVTDVGEISRVHLYSFFCDCRNKKIVPLMSSIKVIISLFRLCCLLFLICLHRCMACALSGYSLLGNLWRHGVHRQGCKTF